MPVTLTKSELNTILVEERKRQAVKHSHSAFMSKTRGIYTGQQNRIKATLNNPAAELPFSLVQLREAAEEALRAPCRYCGGKLTVKKLAADHAKSISSGGSWGLENLIFCCTEDNLRKGKWSSKEYKIMLRCAEKYLCPASLTDFKRRLVIGGKWTFK